MLADPDHGTEYEGKIIFFGIDEGAALFRKGRADIAEKLIALSAESRAFKIRKVMFTQKPTADFVPTGYLDNFDGRICMRVKRRITATNFLGIPSEELEYRPEGLLNGEFIMDWPGWLKPRYGRSFISNRMKKR